MQPTLVHEPFHRDGWVYEEKVDGWRIVAHKDGRRGWLVSRTGRDHAARFPGVADAVRRLSARTLVIDGELCVFDERLVSRFDLLSVPDERVITTPPVLIAFDLLYARGRELRSKST
jgi:bifunctional non-homologous end joining protein LigD